MVSSKCVCLAIVVLLSTTIYAQQTIYFKTDHIYAGPNGKEIATMSPLPSDQTAPGNPTLNTPTVNPTSVSLTWSSVTDTGGSGLAGYKIYRQRGSGASLPVGTVTGTSFTDQPLQPSTAYTYKIVAFDNAQNHSSGSNSANATTSAMGSDTTAPTVPPGASGKALAWNKLRVDWQRSIDNGGSGIAGYKVYRGGSLISGAGPITNLYYEDTTVAGNTTYSYTIKAIDNATNASADTPAVQVTTPREVIFSDNFDRADGGLGSNWVTGSQTPPGFTTSTWSILANQAAAFGSAGVNGWSLAWANPTVTDFRATVTMTGSNTMAVPFWGDNGQARYVAVNGASGYMTLYYCANGTTELGSCNTVAAYSGSSPNATFSVEAVSSSRLIKVYQGGVLRITYTETNTSRPNSGRVGILAWIYGANAIYADNFLLER